MRGFPGVSLKSCAAGLLLTLAWADGASLRAQSLARPGWAGSGLTVSEWWRNAVLFQVSAPAATNCQAGQAGAQSALADLTGELDDLQTLGADALLLRGLDRGAQTAGGRVAEGYGTMDQFDSLLQAASQRRIRVLVELPGSLDDEGMRAAARFWLSRGVSGLSLGASTDNPNDADGTAAARAAALREVLHGYAGNRVLLVPSGAAGSTGNGPELVRTTIRGFPATSSGTGSVDVAAVRESLVAAASAAGRRQASVAEISADASSASGMAAEARAAVLLMVSGGVVLRAGEVGAGPGMQAVEAAKAQQEKDRAELAKATSPAGISNVKRAIAAREAAEPPRFAGDAVFRWTERMVGLHRGSPAMSLGTQDLLNHDKDGVIVSVWRGRAGQVLCEVVNLRDQPAEVSLAAEFAAMHERGSFLRPVARTDQGMGAMPLAGIHLPGFGVFLGELGR